MDKKYKLAEIKEIYESVISTEYSHMYQPCGFLH